MKKRSILLSAMAAAVFAASAGTLVACGDGVDLPTGQGGGGGGGGGGGTTHVVTFNPGDDAKLVGITDNTMTTNTAGKLTGVMPTAEKLTNPEDYTFDGWAFTSGGDVVLTPTNFNSWQFTADTPVYAVFSEDTEKGKDDGKDDGKDEDNTDPTGVYTITFDYGNGTGSPASAQTANGKLSSLPTPTPNDSDYEFAGWYTERYGSGNYVTENYTFSASGTIYAYYTYVGHQDDEPSLASVYINGTKQSIKLLEGTDGAPVKPDNLLFNYYADGVTLEKDDTVKFEIDGVTIEKVWAKGGSAIVGVTGKLDPQGVNITGDTVTVLASGTYTISVSQYDDQVAENKVSIYIGSYDGPWDGNDDPVVDTAVYINGTKQDITLLPGTDGAPTKPENLIFNYYATGVTLEKDDTVKFVIDGVTIEKVWAKGGSAIVGVTGKLDNQGINITGDTVTVLAGGTYTISVSQYQDQVAENKVSIYIGEYNGPWDNNTDPDNPDNPTVETAVYINGQKKDITLLPGTDGADTKPENLIFNYYATGVTLEKGDTVKFVIDGVTISKVWAKGGSAIVGVTGAKDEQGVNITGDTVTVLAGGTYTISISQYQDQVGENKVSIYIGAYAGPWDNNTDPDNPDNPDNPETEATLKHGTTNVEFGTSDKGDDTCEWQLEAKSVSLTQGETLQFMVDGTAVQVWMEGHVKDATCGKTHICTVAIEGFKTNPRPTSFKVLTTGVYDFYLKYYGPFDGASNGGYVVWVEGPGEAGTNDDEYVEGDYYIVGIGGVWNTVQSKYHLGATKGSLTLTLTANAEFKIAKCGTDGATDWDSANYGREAVVAGVGYLDSTSTNIKIKTAGTYTISFNNGEISISSSDVTEPGVNLPATKLTLKFNDATITVGFDYPDYGTEGPWIYVFKGSNPVDSTNGAWPGYKLDGSQVTINANLADCKIIISFKQGNDTKQSFDTDTTKFKDGSSYLLSIGNWADDGTGTWKYNLVIVEA